MILRLTIFIVTLMLWFIVYECDAHVTYLDGDNLESVLQNNQIVFVAFCADWCPFSGRLKPIFIEAADTFLKENPKANVTWAIVDSVQHAAISERYFVTKYPTLKIFISGELASKEYRAARSVAALTSFVKEKYLSSIREYMNDEELESNIDRSRRNIIIQLAKKEGAEYDNIKKLSSILHDDCAFWFKVNGDSNSLTFRDPTTDDTQNFDGNLGDYNYIKSWLTDKCIPLVREVTFENVEELTEEGLPFLLLFRDPSDKEIVKVFTEVVLRELHDQKMAINILLADGLKFAHPLRHLGRTTANLPLLAIDSFQHMFLFPDMKELTVAGKLRQFILDLHSGKLHKDLHANMDKKVAEIENSIKEQKKIAVGNDMNIPSSAEESTAPPSVFKNLKPSETRYSLLHRTEL